MNCALDKEKKKLRLLTSSQQPLDNETLVSILDAYELSHYQKHEINVPLEPVLEIYLDSVYNSPELVTYGWTYVVSEKFYVPQTKPLDRDYLLALRKGTVRICHVNSKGVLGIMQLEAEGYSSNSPNLSFATGLYAFYNTPDNMKLYNVFAGEYTGYYFTCEEDYVLESKDGYKNPNLKEVFIPYGIETIKWTY